MRRFVAVAAVIGLLGWPARANAQGDPIAQPDSLPAPSEASLVSDAVLGIELGFLVPRGDFRPGAGLAVGYGVRGAVGIGARKLVDVGAAFRSVALDSWMVHDRREVKNMLRTLTASGRLVAPLRFARPYLGGSVGGAYFGTETMVEECCDDEGDPEWVLEDIASARILPIASARVGLLVDLWREGSRGRPMLSVDLGVEDHYGRRGSYLREVDGRVERSGMNHRVYSLGLTIRSR
jgi:hypothetical protein